MLSLGTGGSSDEDEDRAFLDENLALKMIQLLQEHGWDFTYGRDPVLILIEYEETTSDGERDENET